MNEEKFICYNTIINFLPKIHKIVNSFPTGPNPWKTALSTMGVITRRIQRFFFLTPLSELAPSGAENTANNKLIV